MSRSSDLESRLRSESEFQNRRIRAGYDVEARVNFYYLAEKARARYWQLLSDVAGKRVLVVGCADGGVTPLARKGAVVTGVDVADEPLRRLKGAICREGLRDHASCLVMNAEDLAFRADSFDMICCAGVLHHLDVERAASSWAQVLKPAGRVAMLEPMAYHPLVMLYRFLTPSQRTPDEHPLLLKDIAILHAHFGRVEATGYVLLSPLSLVLALLPNVLSLKVRLLAALERIDSWLLGHIPWLKYLCWTCVIQLAEPLKIPRGRNQRHTVSERERVFEA
jgi:SAM-dependent methyltransferase